MDFFDPFNPPRERKQPKPVKTPEFKQHEEQRESLYRATGVEFDKDPDGRVFPKATETNLSLGIRPPKLTEGGRVDLDSRREADDYVQNIPRTAEQIAAAKEKRSQLSEVLRGQRAALDNFDMEHGAKKFKRKVRNPDFGNVEGVPFEIEEEGFDFEGVEDDDTRAALLESRSYIADEYSRYEKSLNDIDMEIGNLHTAREQWLDQQRKATGVRSAQPEQEQAGTPAEAARLEIGSNEWYQAIEAHGGVVGGGRNKLPSPFEPQDGTIVGPDDPIPQGAPGFHREVVGQGDGVTAQVTDTPMEAESLGYKIEPDGTMTRATVVEGQPEAVVEQTKPKFLMQDRLDRMQQAGATPYSIAQELSQNDKALKRYLDRPNLREEHRAYNESQLQQNAAYLATFMDQLSDKERKDIDPGLLDRALDLLVQSPGSAASSYLYSGIAGLARAADIGSQWLDNTFFGDSYEQGEGMFPEIARLAQELSRESGAAWGIGEVAQGRIENQISGVLLGQLPAQMTLTYLSSPAKVFQGASKAMRGANYVARNTQVGITSMWGAMFDENMSEAEHTMMKSFDEMSPDERSKAAKSAVVGATAQTALERLGVGIVLGQKIFKNSKQLNTDKFLQEFLGKGHFEKFAKGFLGEGFTETGQEYLKDAVAKFFYDADRDLWDEESVMERLKMFFIGGIAGGVARGVTGAYQDIMSERVAQMSEEEKKEIREGLFREYGYQVAMGDFAQELGPVEFNKLTPEEKKQAVDARFKEMKISDEERATIEAEISKIVDAKPPAGSGLQEFKVTHEGIKRTVWAESMEDAVQILNDQGITDNVTIESAPEPQGELEIIPTTVFADKDGNEVTIEGGPTEAVKKLPEDFKSVSMKSGEPIERPKQTQDKEAERQGQEIDPDGDFSNLGEKDLIKFREALAKKLEKVGKVRKDGLPIDPDYYSIKNNLKLVDELLAGYKAKSVSKPNKETTNDGPKLDTTDSNNPPASDPAGSDGAADQPGDAGAESGVELTDSERKEVKRSLEASFTGRDMVVTAKQYESAKGDGSLPTMVQGAGREVAKSKGLTYKDLVDSGELEATPEGDGYRIRVAREQAQTPRAKAVDTIKSNLKLSAKGVAAVDEIADVIERVVGPDAFSRITVEAVTADQMPEGFKDRAGVWDRGSFKLQINKDVAAKKGDGAIEPIFHESGHVIAEAMDDFILKEYQSLKPEQREAAKLEYEPSDTRTDEELLDSKNARQEWFNFQLFRVAKEGPKTYREDSSLSDSFKERVIKAWEEISQMIRQWIGDASLSTEAMDAKIREILFSETPMVSNDTTQTSQRDASRSGTGDGVSPGAGQPAVPTSLDVDKEIRDLKKRVTKEGHRIYNRDVPVSQIVVNKDIPQFKEDADPVSGVEEGKRLSGEFSPYAPPIIVLEKISGEIEVITGRHRLDLAKQNNMETIPALVHKESEGFTIHDAIILDATENIRDGQGKVKDYAYFFKQANVTRQEAEQGGLLSRDKGRQGWALGQEAVEGLFDLYANGKIAGPKAAAIAEAAPNNEAAQMLAAKRDRQNKSLSPEQLKRFTQQVARMGGVETEGVSQMGLGDLMGSDDFQRIEAEAAKFGDAQAEMVKEINERIRAGNNASKYPDAAKKMGIDVQNPEATQRQIEELREELARIDDPDADMIDRIRERAGLPPENRANAESKPKTPPEDPNQDSLFGDDDTFSLASDTASDGDLDLQAERDRREAEAEAEKNQTQMFDGEELKPATKPAAKPKPAPKTEEDQAYDKLGDAFGDMAFAPREKGTPETELNSGFYSQLERVIEKKMPKLAPPSQVRGIIDPTKGSGVKAEEIKWSGIDQALTEMAREKSHYGKVDKAELLDYLRDAGRVRFEEVALGDIDGNRAKLSAYRRRMESGEALQGDEQRDYDRLAASDDNGADNTRFNQPDLILPGGENYREVVLAMPAMPRAAGAYSVVDRESKKKIKVFDTYEAAEAFASTIKDKPVFVGERISDYDEEGTSYTSSHFPDTPNYVAHMRTNERVAGVEEATAAYRSYVASLDAKYGEKYSPQWTEAEQAKVKSLNAATQGSRGLFIEEIQSDRHQAGREKGYKGEKAPSWDFQNPETGGMVGGFASKEAALKWQQSTERQDVKSWTLVETKDLSGIADAPFRKEWPLAMFKRALRDAVADGKDWIGWTVGETQADRYDLSKQVDRVVWDELGEKLVASKDGRALIERNGVKKNDLSGIVGKEVAARLIEQSESKSGRRTLSGEELSIGGEGMKGFYDKMLPSMVQKYVKKWGGKVEDGYIGPTRSQVETEMDQLSSDNREDRIRFTELAKRRERAEENGVPIHRVAITPAMRESISGEGQMAFAPREIDAPTQKLPKNPDINMVFEPMTQAEEAGKSKEEVESVYRKANERYDRLQKRYEERLKQWVKDSPKVFGWTWKADSYKGQFDRALVVSPDPKGAWRYTNFDRGLMEPMDEWVPSGHSEHETKLAAVEDAVQGYLQGYHGNNAKLIDGEMAFAPRETEAFNRPFPKDKRTAFMGVIEKLADAGINTPEALVKGLEERLGGKLRPYTQTIWNGLSMFDATAAQTPMPDWGAVYSGLNKPEVNPVEQFKEDLSTLGSADFEGATYKVIESDGQPGTYFVQRTVDGVRGRVSEDVGSIEAAQQAAVEIIEGRRQITNKPQTPQSAEAAQGTEATENATPAVEEAQQEAEIDPKRLTKADVTKFVSLPDGTKGFVTSVKGSQVKLLIDGEQRTIDQTETPLERVTPRGRSNVAGGSALASGGNVSIDEFVPDESVHTGEEMKLFEASKALIKKHGGGKRIMEGRNPKGTLGISYGNTGNIAIASLNNISVAVHEVAHNVDRDIGLSLRTMIKVGTTSNGNPKYDPATAKERRQLTDVYVEYYPGGKRTHPLHTRMVEGFATFIQKSIENPKAMRARFPELTAMFLSRDGKYYDERVMALFRDARQIVNAYSKLSNNLKIEARKTNSVNKKQRRWLSIKDMVETTMADEIWPMEKLATISGEQMTDADPSIFARQYKRVSSMVNHNLQKNFVGGRSYLAWRNGSIETLYDFNWSTLLSDLQKTKMESFFDNYLISRRTVSDFKKLDELKAEIERVNSEMEAFESDKDIPKKLVEEMKGLVDSHNRLESILDKNKISRAVAEGQIKEAQETIPDIAKLEKMFDALVRADLDTLLDAGIISKKDHARYAAEEGYATFKRDVYDDLIDPETGNVNPNNITGKSISTLKARTGSDKAIISPLYSSIANHNEIAHKAMRQTVWNKMADLADSHSEIMGEVMQKEPLQVSYDPKTGKAFYPQDQDENVMMARRDGKRIPYAMNSDLKIVLDGVMTPEAFGWVERFFVFRNRIFTKGTTGLYMGFAFMNLIVDQISAVAQSRTLYLPVFSQVKQIWKMTRDSDSKEYAYLREYLQNAGVSQTRTGWNELPPDKAKQIIAGESRGLAAIKKTIWAGEKVLGAPAQATEIFTRATEYISARSSGDSIPVALEKAGRIAGPFHHIGRLAPLKKNVSHSGKAVVRSISYMNAAIQVNKEYSKAMVDPKRRNRAIAVTGLLMGAKLAELIPMMLMATDDQKEKYKDMEGEYFSRYLFLPSRNGVDLNRYRIPEQMTFLAAPMNMFLQNYLMGNNYTGGDMMGAGTAFIPENLDPTVFIPNSVIDDNFSPETFFWGWMPQAITPELEVFFNRRTWPKVRDLEPQWMISGQNSLLPQDRSFSTTSGVAEWIGDQMELSPIKVDHYLQGVFGRTVKMLTKPKSEFEKQMQPYLQRYYFTAGRNVQDFYEQAEKTEQLLGSIKSLKSKVDDKHLDQLVRDKQIVDETKSLLRSYRAISDEEIESSPAALQLRKDILNSMHRLSANPLTSPTGEGPKRVKPPKEDKAKPKPKPTASKAPSRAPESRSLATRLPQPEIAEPELPTLRRRRNRLPSPFTAA